jgi:hypothetical protein
MSDTLLHTIPEVPHGFTFAPAALIEERALQQRVDRKYLIGINELDAFIARLRSGYCLLRAGQHVWARYQSIYLDTRDRDLYHAHRRGRRPRYKVRIRHHLDRELTFLEIKRKETNGRTVKFRLALAAGQEELGRHESMFIESHTGLDAMRLFPRLSISFRRLTLLGCEINERVTLDGDLAVSSETESEELGRIVFAEVKQPHRGSHGGAAETLRTLNAREEALSKYCLGTILVAPVRANVFKPTLRTIRRLSA